jgi:hypothetical protein
VQNSPDRLSDLAWRKHGGRHLIEERLERMMVLSVDESYVDLCIAQRLSGPQPAKAATDDHYSWSLAQCLLP